MLVSFILASYIKAEILSTNLHFTSRCIVSRHVSINFRFISVTKTKGRQSVQNKIKLYRIYQLSVTENRGSYF